MAFRSWHSRSPSIPAYAGEPGGYCRRPPDSHVYPRVCGGTRHHPGPVQSGHRLSPRMQGNPAFRLAGGEGRTSIPAYAGEPVPVMADLLGRGVYPRVCGGTATRTSPKTARPVYPRVCGGTVTSPPYDNLRQRLSPRMRGNPARIRVQVRQSPSIPAYAGEPPAPQPIQARRWSIPAYGGEPGRRPSPHPR